MKLSEFDFRIYHNIRNEYITDKYIISNLFNDLINGATDLIMDYEIELFTGLCDKNGNKVYEGDILKCDTTLGYTTGGIYKVEFERSGAFFLNNKDDSWLMCEANLEHFEVIGNIHENEKLLK